MEYLSEYLLSHLQKPIYKKYLPCPNIKHEKYEEQIISRVIQQTIAKILMDNPNPHVINIYEQRTCFAGMIPAEFPVCKPFRFGYITGFMVSKITA